LPAPADLLARLRGPGGASRADREHLAELSRRGLLGLGAATLAGCALSDSLRPTELLLTDDVPPDPFQLGVASGDPTPDGFVLWTRLAPEPLRGGGMPDRAVVVDWEIATDERMQDVVRSGQALARPALGHSVHVEVAGLPSAQWFHYRFRTGREGRHVSAVGRTRTAPAPGAPTDRLRFAFLSCHHYQQGLYTGYAHLVKEPLDLVLHLGDYIYEGPAPAKPLRGTVNGPAYTLDEYRARYALYKTDPLLQGVHAAFPWAVTWDDHEVEDNYAGERTIKDADPRLFLLRRAAAYQAYYEHMPLRLVSAPRGADVQLYRRLGWGDLAQLHVLDTRQYRTGKPGHSGPKLPSDEGALADPAAPSMLGPRQEAWLAEGLAAGVPGKTRWNVLAQGIFVSQRLLPGRTPIDEASVSLDAWDAFPAARRRLISLLESRKPANPVILTGDVHANFAVDLEANFDDPESPTLGAELVGTSLSSSGDGSDTTSGTAALLAANPHIKLHNAQRGYVVCDATARRLDAHFRVMPFVTRPGAPISTRATFAIEDAKPGLQKTAG
jgi:alkaline phosphatase D